MVLIVVFATQVPLIRPLRSWSYSALLGLLGAVFQGIGTANASSVVAPFIHFIALVCYAAMVVFLFRGLRLLSNADPSRDRIAAIVTGGLLLVSVIVRWVLAGSGFGQAMVSADRLVLPIACGLLATYTWSKHRHFKSVATGLSVVLAATFVAGLNEYLFSERWHALTGGSFAGSNRIASSLAIVHLTFAIVYLAIQQMGQTMSAMEASRDEMSDLVEAGFNAVCRLDTEGRIAFMNPAAAEILALNPEMAIGELVRERLEPWRDEESARTLAAFEMRPLLRIENSLARVAKADGKQTIVEWSTSPMVQGGIHVGSVMSLRNVTERDIDTHYAHLRSEVLELMTRNRPVDDVSKFLVDMLEQRLPEFRCSVLHFGVEFFRVAAAPSVPQEYRSAMNLIPCNRSFRAFERITGSEKQWERVLRGIAPTFGFEGTWTEPMVSSVNELLGIVVLNSSEMRPLTPKERQVFADIGHLAALAVEHRRSFERLLHQGHHDALTGLPNRLLLADRLKQALARAERSRTQLAMMCIDLDRFKYINDTLGHDIGDQFLQQITVRLQARIRSADTLARTGGDEFTVLLSDVQDPGSAVRVAESLVASLNEPFQIEDHTLSGSATIGIAFYPKDGTDAESLHRNADRAMYRGKALGKNRVQCYSNADASEESDRIEIDSHLRHAIEQGHFTLNYQPQFTCDRRLAGFEALLRFKHPKLGLIPPSRFIPMAEESGLVLPIGEWVLDQVCRQIAEWVSKGIPPVHVAVNVSPLQFAQADFASTVARMLKLHNITPDLVELEVTEGVVMGSIHDSKLQMDAIAKTGVRLSVDDFGTGYSSLSYLHQLPIQVLKVDRSFIAKMLDPGGTRCIVDAIISLAHRLGLKTVAEGVETSEQLALLREAGCDLIQGFFFSYPLSAIEATRLLWQESMMESYSPLPATGASAHIQ